MLLAISVVETSKSFHSITLETSAKLVTIQKVKCPEAVLLVVVELSFVGEPVVLVPAVEVVVVD